MPWRLSWSNSSSANSRGCVRHILVYGDSLTWGIIPDTRNRLPFEQRWPGVMESALNRGAHAYRVVEDCLNGRRTVWDDPFKSGRNGSAGLAQSIEKHSPLALVLIMLGTNDFQSTHQHHVALSAQGIAALVAIIRQAPIEPGMPVPPVLVVAPPPMGTPAGAIAAKFHGARERSEGLAAAYAGVCQSAGCHFFDAGSVTPASCVDGVHLDACQHAILGSALADAVMRILEQAP
jgi:lysophospholipase L1-like esterase